MKIAIVSDIEGNDKKLDNVLLHLDRIGYDQLVNLGDAIGTRGDSDKILETLQKRCAISVYGNHDLEALLGKSVPASIVTAQMFAGSDGVYHNMIKLKPENLKYLAGLDVQHIMESDGTKYGMVHSFYGDLNGERYFDYFSRLNSVDFAEKMNCDALFVGHKHIPGIIKIKKTDRTVDMNEVSESTLVEIDRDKYVYIINVGSVGAPRKGWGASSFAILDSEEMRAYLIIDKQ